MPNAALFNNRKPSTLNADAVNASGGRAYKMSDQDALAQIITTSCFNNTFYATAGEQLDTVKKLAGSCTTEFLAKAAVYAFEKAYMRDTAVYLLACLTTRGPEGIRYFEKAFPRVVVNVNMLRNFVQIIRSGQVVRKSFGTVPKRVIKKWLASKSADWLFVGSMGNDPSFADVIKMVHPKPASDEQRAFYGYMLDKQYDYAKLPAKVAEFEMFKACRAKGVNAPVPDLPFQMMSTLSLNTEEWRGIALNMPWKTLQKNLEMLRRHNVYDDAATMSKLADKLRDKEAIKRAKVFPYQLLTAYKHTTNVPMEIRNALQEAMEIATENVPTFATNVAVCLDVSQSMSSPITGQRIGSTTVTKCVEVASLMAATILRRNKNAVFLPFDLTLHNGSANINPFDSVMTNAEKMSRMGGGGTDCALPLRALNGMSKENKPKLVVMVSDNESWHLNGGYWHQSGWRTYGYQFGITSQPSSMAAEWAKYRKDVPDARLVCIDLTPNTTTQVKDGDSVLNIGGFSDNIWSVIDKFSRGVSTSFNQEIDNVVL